MQVVAAAKAQVVAQAKAECEELLVAIVQVGRPRTGSREPCSCAYVLKLHSLCESSPNTNKKRSPDTM
jgi:hypothetical protein